MVFKRDLKGIKGGFKGTFGSSVGEEEKENFGKWEVKREHSD
jgi:hypothetical protein